MVEQENVSPEKNWHQRWWGVVLLLIPAIVLLYGGIYIYQVIVYSNSDPTPVLNNQSIILPTPIDNDPLINGDTSPTIGPANAQLVIVEFADFQCPYCKEAHETMRRLREEYSGSVKFVHRDVTNHSNSLAAALAARCANEQKKFWQYGDNLYENQNNLTTETLNLIAYQLGLNLTQFSQCFNNQKYLPEVQSDLQAALDLKIQGTPTFYLNGHRVAGVIPYDSFKEVIDQALQLIADEDKQNINQNINSL